MPESDNAWALDALQTLPDQARRAAMATEEAGLRSSGADPGVEFYNAEWDKGQSVEKLTQLERESRSEGFRQWLRSAPNPALIADSIDSLTAMRRTIDSIREPDPTTYWEMFSTGVKTSGAYLYTGAAALPAAAVSIPHWAGLIDGDSPFTKLTEVARAHYDARADESSEQAYRNEQSGGSRIKLIAGSLLGQAPEMVATGFGTTSAVKSLFQLAVGAKTALTAAQLRAAFMTSSAIQAGMEASKNTVSRMSTNVANGEDALQAEDVAAGLAIAAVTMFTEIPGGMRGEFRALSGRTFANKAGEIGKDVVVQSSQEAFQEGATQIINDLADGSYINWSEVGWSALAGAIGGGLFSGPSAIGVILGDSTDPARTLETLRIATAAAQAPQVLKFSEGVAAAMSRAASTPQIASQSETTLRQLFQGETNGDIHLSLDDFATLASKRGTSTQSLLIEMGGNSGGGDVAIPAENFMANMVKNSPELVDEAKMMVKQDASSPSRNDMGDIIDAMETLKQRKITDTLPDGVTKDDSQDIVAEMTAEVTTAAAVAGAKLTEGQIRTAAELVAVQSRAAAIEWNKAYEAQGKTERVTPKQLWGKYRAAVTGETGAGGLQQITLYHAGKSASPIQQFNKPSAGGVGIWFGSSPEGVSMHGTPHAYRVDASKPGKMTDLAAAKANAVKDGHEPGTEAFNDAVVSNLEAAGFDSINDPSFKGAGPQGVGSWMVLRPEQIQPLQQQGDGAPRGSYDWNKTLVRIGKAADASTVHHELMHHWIEVTKAWASDPNAPEVFRQNLAEMGAWAAKNAKKVASVYEKVSGKTVDPESIAAAAGDMLNLNLNSQAGKAIHEAIAYGYEQYLTEGKAPTKELKRIFRSIANYFNKIIKQLMRAETLTDPALTRVFDRMLTAADAKVIGHLTPEAIGSSGMSPEMASLLSDLYGEQIADAQQKAYAKVMEQVKADYEKQLASMAEERKQELLTQPVYKAQVALTVGQDGTVRRLDADKVKGLLAGTEHANLDLSLYTQAAGGMDPVDAKDTFGFSGSPVDMLVELAASKPVDVVAKQDAEAEMADAPTAAEQAQEIVDSDSGSLLVAVAELRVLRQPAKVSGQAAKEATEATKEADAAKVDAARAKVKEVRAKTKEEVAAAREKAKQDSATARQKAKDLADRAKMRKLGWAADGKRLQAEMRQDMDVQITAGAEYRLETDPKTASELSTAIEAAARNLAKNARKDDIQAALLAYIEVETLTEMQRMVAAQAKTEFADTLSALKTAAREDRADARRTALEALKSGAMRDANVLKAWAHEQVRRMPMTELRADLWAKRIEAARSRREVAAAKQDSAKIVSATEEIAYGLAMQQEILRTLAARQSMMADLVRFTKSDELQYLANSGYPTVVNGNVVTVYETQQAAEDALAVAPHGSTIGRTSDLHDVGRSIAGLLSKQKPTQAAAIRALVVLKEQNPGLITPEVQRMLENGKLPLMAGPGYGPDLVKAFTTDDFKALTDQIVFIRQVAKDRPSVAKDQGQLIVDATNAIPKNAKPQVDSAWRDFAYRTMKNVTVHLQPLGVFGQKIIAKMDDANVQQNEYQRQIGKIVAPAQRALYADKVNREERKNIMGVDTSRHEDLVRLLMLGTQTGRQRVAADLELRVKGISVNQYISTISTVTATEAAWLDAMWKANDMIWAWDAAAARAHGVPLPKKLEATGVPVVVDGQVVELSGGYASVPYVNGEGPVFDMLTASKTRPADVARGLFKDREDVVLGRNLDLTSTAQIRSQMSHIRTAAYLGLATEMRVLLAPDSAFRLTAEERLGKGWVIDFQKYLQFTITGVKPMTKFEGMFRWLHRAQTMSVFGANFTSAANQITGVLTSVGHPNIGARAMIGASGRILSEMMAAGSIRKPFQRIGGQSAEMQQRSDGQSLDWATIDELPGKETAWGKWQNFATTPMRRMQQIVDTITYQAAYERAMSDLPADVTGNARLAQAKRIATNAVKDTQGTALRSRQSEIAQSQFGVCATFAGKWMMNNANWLTTLYLNAKQQGWKGGKKDFLVATFTSVIGTTAAMIALRAALQPEDDDEEQRDLQDYAIKLGIDSVSQPWYLGRIVAGLIQQTVTDQQWSRSVDIVPQLTPAVDGMTLIIQQIRDSKDSDDVPKILAGLVSVGGLVPGVPAVQLRRAIDAAAKGERDGWEDTWELFMQGFFGPDRVPMIR